MIDRLLLIEHTRDVSRKNDRVYGCTNFVCLRTTTYVVPISQLCYQGCLHSTGLPATTESSLYASSIYVEQNGRDVPQNIRQDVEYRCDIIATASRGTHNEAYYIFVTVFVLIFRMACTP